MSQLPGQLPGPEEQGSELPPPPPTYGELQRRRPRWMGSPGLAAGSGTVSSAG